MKTWPKLAALLLLTTSLVSADLIAIDNKPAYGCSCMRPGSASEERDRTTAVFSGTASRITPTAQGSYTVHFTVDEQWKGESASTLQVQTAGNSAACGYNFEAGKDYLVYAYASGDDPLTAENILSVGLCGRTNLLANATEDIVELNSQPAAPSTENTEGTQSGCR